MTDRRKRIEELTRRLEHVQARLEAHESAAAAATRPLSPSFERKLADIQADYDRIVSHLRTLRAEDAAHWNRIDPVAGGLLQGLLAMCDTLGARLQAAAESED